MKIHLAPMEGVVDPIMRKILTGIGGIDRCITEFIRVTDRLLPASVYHKYAPELLQGSKTDAGTPLFIQLLGGQPQPLAENAALAAELGAAGIDLNFGCPAKTVNRHDGGAAILKCPERLYHIITAVKKAVPEGVPITAKIRLGFDVPDFALDIARAVEAAEANLLTVHGRTKLDAYKPPARWEWIAKIREAVSIPVMANGEVWTIADYYRCREVTGCEDVMIGRGAIADPFLCLQIKQSLRGEEIYQPSLDEIKALLLKLYGESEKLRHGGFAVARSKQWLRQLARSHPQVAELFNEIKVLHDPEEFRPKLQAFLGSPQIPADPQQKTDATAESLLG